MPSLPRLMNSTSLSLPGLDRLSCVVLSPICNFFWLHITVFSETSVYMVIAHLLCGIQSGPTKVRWLVTSMFFNEIKRFFGDRITELQSKALVYR